MATHDFSRHATIYQCEDGPRSYKYTCDNCGVEFWHDYPLDHDDFEYHDYCSEVPCDPDDDTSYETPEILKELLKRHGAWIEQRP